MTEVAGSEHVHPFLRSVLEHGQIWLSSRSKLNDPFDAAPRVVFGGTQSEVEAYFRYHIDNRFPGLGVESQRQLIAENTASYLADPEHFARRTQLGWERDLEQCGIYCLSESGTIPRMWAHYADGHRGVCLEFSTIRPGSVFQQAHRVVYGNGPLIVNPIADLARAPGLAVLCKSTDWAYEREWRLVNQGASGLLQIDASTLVGVILGARVPDTVASTIKELARSTNPEVNIRRSVLDADHAAVRLESELEDAC